MLTDTLMIDYPQTRCVEEWHGLFKVLATNYLWNGAR